MQVEHGALHESQVDVELLKKFLNKELFFS